jgi:hypothetical protein
MFVAWGKTNVKYTSRTFAWNHWIYIIFRHKKRSAFKNWINKGNKRVNMLRELHCVYTSQHLIPFNTYSMLFLYCTKLRK